MAVSLLTVSTMKEKIEARIAEVLLLQSTLDDMPLSDEAQAAFIAYTRGRLAALRGEIEKDNG